MEPRELEQLAFWASRHVCIVEIGSFMGRSTRAMADATSGVVVAYDDFQGLRERDDNPHPEEIRAAFHRNLADHLAAGKVVLKEMDHARPRVMTADMVFIDGSHDYRSVARDIRLWYPVTTHLLCGHDFDDAHPEVQRAVRDLFVEFHVVKGTSLWWVTR